MDSTVFAWPYNRNGMNLVSRKISYYIFLRENYFLSSRTICIDSIDTDQFKLLRIPIRNAQTIKRSNTDENNFTHTHQHINIEMSNWFVRITSIFIEIFNWWIGSRFDVKLFSIVFAEISLKTPPNRLIVSRMNDFTYTWTRHRQMNGENVDVWSIILFVIHSQKIFIAIQT